MGPPKMMGTTDPTDPLTAAINHANVVLGTTSFLNGASAAGSSGPVATGNSSSLGSQLTNDLTNVGNVVNLLQGKDPASGSQTTPDISGSAQLLGQPHNDPNLLLPNQH
jgi:hypothetical protein